MSGKTQRTGERANEGDSSDLEVVLWSRRPVCGSRTTAIDRLGELRSAGTIDGFAVETWPDEVVVSGRDEGLLATVERFERWADEAGVSLRPPFETRTSSALVGESRVVLTTPMLLAAVRDGGDLVGVYPCTDGERTWTVTDLLDALDAGADLPHAAD